MAEKGSEQAGKTSLSGLTGYSVSVSLGPMGYGYVAPALKEKRSPSHFSLSRAVEFVGRIRSLIFDTLFMVLVLALITLAIYLAFSQHQIVIEPIKAPKSLTDIGYGGEASAHRLMAAIKSVEKAAKARRKNLDVIPKSRKVEIAIPEIGTLFDTILHYAKKLMSRQDTIVAGEFVCIAADCGRNSADLRLRLFGATEATIEVPATSKTGTSTTDDPLFQLAAVKVLEKVRPYIVAAYYFDRHPERARAILRRIILKSNSSSELALAHNLAGAMDLQSGRYREAIAKFEIAVEHDPKLVEAFSNWGNAYLAQYKYPEAVEKYEHAISLNPEFATAHANIGDALLRQGQTEAAIGRYKKAIKIEPGLAFAYANLGDAHTRLGDDYRTSGEDEMHRRAYQAALQYYQDATAIEPNLAFAYVSWGNALLKLGDREGARRKYDRALEKAHNADIANKVGVLAYTYSSLGDWHSRQPGGKASARQAYQNALEQRDDNLQALVGLGDIHLGDKSFDKAIDLYGQAVAKKADYSRAFVGLGKAHLGVVTKLSRDLRGIEDESTASSLKQEFERTFQKSEAAFSDALNSREKVLNANEGLGQLYLLKHDYAGAAKFFEAEIQVNKNAVHSFAGLGTARLRMKDYPGAVKAYQAAVKVNGSIAYIHADLGGALHRIKDYVAAIDAYRAALALNGRLAYAHAGLGDAYLADKQSGSAVDSYLSATELPRHPAYFYANLAQLLLKAKRHEDLRIAMARWIGREAERVEPYLFLGRSHSAVENWTAARTAFQNVVDRIDDPAHPLHKQAMEELTAIETHLSGDVEQAPDCGDNSAQPAGCNDSSNANE